jgi:hypothetical protein
MRHVDPTNNPDSNLKVKKDSRRTSLADLIPDWPVLTQRKKSVKVKITKLDNSYYLDFKIFIYWFFFNC